MPVLIAHGQKQVEVISPPKTAAGKGTVFWQEDFESNMNKFTNGTVQNSVVRTGGYALVIVSAGADPWTTTANTQVVGASPEMFNSKVGFELYVNFEANTTAAAGLTSFDFKITLQNGTTQHNAGMGVAFTADGTSCPVRYLKSDNTWANSGSTVDIHSGYFYKMKFIFDPVTDKYDLLIFGAQEIDMSTTAIRTLANTGNTGKIEIILTGVDATVKDARIDDMSLTFNEP